MAQQKPKKLVSLQGELDNNKHKKNQEALSHNIGRAKENNHLAEGHHYCQSSYQIYQPIRLNTYLIKYFLILSFRKKIVECTP